MEQLVSVGWLLLVACCLLLILFVLLFFGFHLFLLLSTGTLLDRRVILGVVVVGGGVVFMHSLDLGVVVWFVRCVVFVSSVSSHLHALLLSSVSFAQCQQSANDFVSETLSLETISSMPSLQIPSRGWLLSGIKLAEDSR